MIEGQPQHQGAQLANHAHFSGLVIEGQPQLCTITGAHRGDFSGLVIEGQPQHPASRRWRARYFSGLVIEGQPQRGAVILLQNIHFSGLVIEGQPQPGVVTVCGGINFSGLVIEGQPQRSSVVAYPETDFVAELTKLNSTIDEINTHFRSIADAIRASDTERKTLQREACRAFTDEFIHSNWAQISAVHDLEKDVASAEIALSELRRSEVSARVKDRVAATFQLLIAGFFGKNIGLIKQISFFSVMTSPWREERIEQ